MFIILVFIIHPNKIYKLNQLTLLENKKGASYKRIRSEIESEKATERITLSEVKEIISQNKKKIEKKQIKVITDKYHKELKKEINDFRELNGRDKYPSDDDNDEGGDVPVNNENMDIPTWLRDRNF